MKILFFIFRVEGDISLNIDGKKVLISEILINEVTETCQRFIDYLGDQVKNQRDISTLANVIIYIFEELSQMILEQKSNDHEPSQNSLKKHLRLFFKLGIKIMNVDRQDVRLVLQEFLEKVGEEYLLR
jgi:hypothetical protein